MFRCRYPLPRAIPPRKTACADRWIPGARLTILSEEIQATATVEEDIQIRHIRNSYFRKPLDEGHVITTTRTAGAACATV